MIDGKLFVTELERLGITHVVWLPDSTLGQWERGLEQSSALQLVRVCREAEAWGVALGLYLGGARPLVIIQCTGLFDSGDALRNAVHDYGVPLFAIIGYRSYLNPTATDLARTFTEPMLTAWNIPYCVIDTPEKFPDLAAHYRHCQQTRSPGVVLIGEGKL